MASSFTIRDLQGTEVEAARRLSNRNPDVFGSYAISRLPIFFEMADISEPANKFAARQQLMLGAWCCDKLVGTVFVERDAAPDDQEAGEEAWQRLQSDYSEQEINVFSILSHELRSAIIAGEDDTLLIHALCVDADYRRVGIARSLLSEVIHRLGKEELSRLSIKVARIRGHRQFCESLGFRVVRRRLSVSDRLQFGCWGSLLLRYYTLQ